jgi:hypothetical protein
MCVLSARLTFVSVANLVLFPHEPRVATFRRKTNFERDEPVPISQAVDARCSCLFSLLLGFSDHRRGWD